MQDTGANPTPYVLTRDGERWVFRPSALHVALMLTGFAAGSVFCVFVAAMFILKANDPLLVGFGAIFLIPAGGLVVSGVWAWRTRRTPLTIEREGRVCYGERELCAAGTARSVRIAPSQGGEAGDCEVCLELEGGTVVSVPSQYFAGFGMKAQARPFAESLAMALEVGVIE